MPSNSSRTRRATPYLVTFLLDRANNWIEGHLLQSKAFVSDKTYRFTISHDHSEVSDRDIVFILGYTRILDKSFLSKNHLNVVIHESDLPLGKGFAPVQWQILEGKKEIPICLLEAGEQVDSGDILFKSSFILSGYELYDEIRAAQAKATFAAISEFLNLFPNITRTRQSGGDSFYRRRTPKDGELNIDKTIREQFDLLRIGNNELWPSFFCVDGKKYLLKIYKSEDS